MALLLIAARLCKSTKDKMHLQQEFFVAPGSFASADSCKLKPIV